SDAWGIAEARPVAGGGAELPRPPRRADANLHGDALEGGNERCCEPTGRAVVTRAPLVAILFAALTGTQGPSYDLLLRNGRIVDGAGNPGYQADVAIRGDAIVRIAQSIPERARRGLDVRGQVVAPGFIDIHIADLFLLLAVR